MTKKLKTAIYGICLNEIKHVDTFMEYNKDADVILICDTGSTDGTAERLRELGATVYDIKISPWRFDVARNTALSLVPADVDICMTVDLDERLTPGWREAMEKFWQETDGQVTRFCYDYIWNWQEDGSPGVRFYGDRWHARHGYTWRHPCHETVYHVGSTPEVRQAIPGLQLHHHADNTKSRGQYLHLLELAVKEDPNNDRMRHYYARELFFKGRHEEAIKEFNHHLTMPSATWREERAASLRYISRSYKSLNDNKASQDYALKSVLECDSTREPWLELARVSYANQDWSSCYWAATKCLSITERTLSYMADNSAWGWEPYDLAALSAYHLKLKDKAVEFGNQALELNPTDQRLAKNLEYYQTI